MRIPSWSVLALGLIACGGGADNPPAADTTAAVSAPAGISLADVAGTWVVTAKAEKHAARCIENVGLDVDVIAGHLHGDEKRDALVAHAARFYVGDTVTDVQAALAANAVAIGVTTGPDDEATLGAAGAHHVVGTLLDFPRLLGLREA